MATIEDDIVIHPDDLVVVAYRYGSATKRVVAFSVGYVAAENRRGQRVIAAEILFDPKRQAPKSPYTCRRYREVLISPRSLLSVRPYDIEE